MAERLDPQRIGEEYEKWDISLKCKNCGHHYTWHHDDERIEDEDTMYFPCTKKGCECDNFDNKEISGENPNAFEGFRAGWKRAVALLSTLKSGVSEQPSDTSQEPHTEVRGLQSDD